MILYRWRGATANFGDELNAILWPRLLPGLFDNDPSVRFLGIGSVLDQRHPEDPVKVVAGSGYGGYEGRPRLDSRWIIHWVRGPRTAAALGLPASLALGDPAALIPAALPSPIPERTGTGFMPHFESAARGAWKQAADIAGVHLIDPRDPPSQILETIATCRVLLTEALHGAIVADALRIPWVAIRPIARIHRPKWADWADTVGLKLRFQPVPASSFSEWANAGVLGSFHASRRLLGCLEPWASWANQDRWTGRAASALMAAARAEPQLSSQTAIDRCQSRMMEAVRILAADPLRAARDSRSSPEMPRRLRLRADSAYELKPVG